MSKAITIVHYWAGCPKSPNSKWNRFLQIVKRSRKEGWKNYLVLSKMPENPGLYEPFEKEGCEIILQHRSRGNFDMGSIWRTYKLLHHLKCDLFHCHNDHTSPLIGATLARVPVRIWSKLAMSPYYEKNEKPKAFHRLMPSTRISCICAHRILAISNKVRDEIIESVGFRKKIDTVYVPVDLERFANASNKSIRSELKLKSSNIIITAVGHAVPVKGWDIAIKAFVKVIKHIPKARLLLVGDSTSSKFQNQLDGLIKELSLEDKIIFTGKRDDIPSILKSSDMFILPSRSEGMPSALIEAMASGLACISSNVGGVPEVITNGENGLLFNREDVHGLAESLIKLFQNKTLQKKLTCNAITRAKDFSVDLYVEKIFRIYMSFFNTGRIK